MAGGLPLQAPGGIALFDLDGTLIAWDCQILFRHFILRRESWRRIFLPVFLIFLPLYGILGDGGMKRVFLSYLYGMTPEKLDEYSREFARFLMPAIYPDLRARMEKHRSEGDFLILASASPEFYVKHMGRELGFDLTLGTPVEIKMRCAFFPDLENHKGIAKVLRLRHVLPASYFAKNGHLVRSHGYTDSRADLPMLGVCDTATVVNPSRMLFHLALSNQWQVERPSRPWKSRVGKAARIFALLHGVGVDPGGVSHAPKSKG